MWLMLVTTVASVVWTDAGYSYTAPNVPFNFPTNINPIPNYQNYNYNKKEELKGDMYINKDYTYNYNTNYNNLQSYGNADYSGILEVLSPPSLLNDATGQLTNAYGGYTDSFSPFTNFNTNNELNNWQPVISSVSGGANNGYVQTFSQLAHNNINVPVTAGYSSYYASQDSNQNFGQTNSINALSNSNSNNGNIQFNTRPVSSVPQIIYGQPYIQIGGNNLKNSNGYAQTTKSETDTGYSQNVQAGSLNSGHIPAEAFSAKGNLNSEYANSFTSSNSFNVNNDYSQTASSSNNNHIHYDYDQHLTPPSGVNLNDGHQQTLTSSGNSVLNSGYEQSSTTSGTKTSSQLPNNPNTGYSESSNGPIHIDLNTDLNQLPTASQISFSNNNLNTEAIQNVVNNKFFNPVPNKPSVTPIVHKHIYFHIPPPEIEEFGKGNSSPLPPKKDYKILFIKMPSQELKSNQIRLQEQMRNAAIEGKTLIYVLVKKPDDPKPVVLPEHKPSKHEVFFVKYNESPFDIAARVNDELDKNGTINSIVPLEPGLVNGKQR